MEINIRLMCIASMVDKCESIIDVGTDHGYIPIYLVKNKLCKKAIASDINKGPISKAALNISLEGLENYIDCRLGSGLLTVKPHEVQGAVVAGMGGNLIKDIIEAGMDVFKELSFAILQPVQNTEVLRRYLYETGFEILDEELCFSENKYYEIFKVRYGNTPVVMSEFDYEISPLLISKRHILIGNYLRYKLKLYEKVFSSIKEDSEAAVERKKHVEGTINRLRELITWL